LEQALQHIGLNRSSLYGQGFFATEARAAIMDASQATERRSLTRNPGDTIRPVRLRLDAAEIVAKVHDISIEGIAILTNHRLEPGSWVLLEPADPNRHLAPELRAEVRHTKLAARQGYIIGCRFARRLTVEDVMALG
jgi:hypothetical protein